MADVTDTKILEGATNHMLEASSNVIRCVKELLSASTDPCTWRRMAEALDKLVITSNECGQGVFAKLHRSQGVICREFANVFERLQQESIDITNITNIQIPEGAPPRLAGACLNVARCAAERDKAMASPVAWRRLAEALEEQAKAADECGYVSFARLYVSSAVISREYANGLQRLQQEFITEEMVRGEKVLKL